MGWLYLSAAHMNGHDTPKAYLDAQFTYAPDPDNGRDHGLRILASAHSSRPIMLPPNAIRKRDRRKYSRLSVLPASTGVTKKA